MSPCWPGGGEAGGRGQPAGPPPSLLQSPALLAEDQPHGLVHVAHHVGCLQEPRVEAKVPVPVERRPLATQGGSGGPLGLGAVHAGAHQDGGAAPGRPLPPCLQVLVEQVGPIDVGHGVVTGENRHSSVRWWRCRDGRGLGRGVAHR